MDIVLGTWLKRHLITRRRLVRVLALSALLLAPLAAAQFTIQAPAKVAGDSATVAVKDAAPPAAYLWYALEHPAGARPEFAHPVARTTTVRFSALGKYRIGCLRLAWEGPDCWPTLRTAKANLKVVATASVTVTPETATVPAGGSQRFAATVADQFGGPWPEPMVSWSASGGGVIAPDGLFTAAADGAGDHLISATCASATGTATVTVVPGALPPAPPTAEPPPGTYADAVRVVLSTPDGVVRYTLDGSDPTAASPDAAGGVPLDGGPVELRARTFAAGGVSDLASFAYAFAVATPTLAPDDGTAATGITVTGATATTGAVLRYTLDGSDPTAADPALPAEGIVLSTGVTTVRVRGEKPGYAPSAIAEATYAVAAPLDPPTATPAPGSFTGPVEVALAAAPGAVVRYTLDGSDPTAGSPAWAPGGLVLDGGPVTVRARAFSATAPPSAIAEFTYRFRVGFVEISPRPGLISDSITVTATVPTPGATLRYVESDREEVEPTSPVLPPEGLPLPVGDHDIRIRGFKAGYDAGATTSGDYYVRLPAPTVSPSGGYYANAVDVAVEPPTTGPPPVRLEYSIDSGEWLPYEGPVHLDGGAFPGTRRLLEVRAYPELYMLAINAYWFRVATPVLTASGGTVTGSTATVGAVLRYTLDGSTPTATSPLLPAAGITPAAGQVVTVVGFRTGYEPSAPAVR